MTPELGIVVVSTNEAHWLRPCLTSVYEHAGDIELDVMVVDNESTDGTRELVESEFPEARVIASENRGFSHANNRGLFATSAPHLLFLNPDTEIREGTFESLVRELRDRPEVGLVGVREVTPDGNVFPTIRRFPTPTRHWFEALAAERFPFRASWLGERELDMSLYDRDVACDWVLGAFMLARREALESAGYLDERFFLYSEEIDLCLRIRNAGWDIRHLPTMTILHHAQKAGHNARLTAQAAYARRQYMNKHFGFVRRTSGIAALYARHGIRAVGPGRNSALAGERRAASRTALRVLMGIERPPFGEPPARALALRSETGAKHPIT